MRTPTTRHQAVCYGCTPTTFQQISTMAIRWKQVTGLVSNVVACLYAVGWNPVSFSEWHSPDGDVWSVPTSADNQCTSIHLIRSIQDHAARVLWSGAAAHFNGSGLGQGFAYGYTMRYLINLRKDNIYDRAAALETIMA